MLIKVSLFQNSPTAMQILGPAVCHSDNGRDVRGCIALFVVSHQFDPKWDPSRHF